MTRFAPGQVWLVVVACGAAACSERALVAGTASDGGIVTRRDLSASESVDLSTNVAADLSVDAALPPVDAPAPPDLAMVPDLARLPDLREPPDLATTPRTMLAFVTPPPVSVGVNGTHVSGLTAGDFNGDGWADLATANWGVGDTGSASVLLGDGRGALMLASSFSVGSGPFTVGTADIDLDGRADLIVGGGYLSTYFGHGDGTFSLGERTAYSGCIVVDLVMHDANGDGRSDVIAAETACGASSGVAVVLTGPGGALGSVTRALLGQTPESIAVGRFGVVMADRGHPQTGTSSAINVLPILASGALGSATVYPTRNFAYSVAAGDLDGDGHDDVVVAEGSGGIGVFRGSAAGFSAEQHDSGPPTVDVVVADFNTDGRLDVATAHSYPSLSVSVWIGNGDGTFAAPISWPLPNDPRDLVVADFDGDGLPDLAAGLAGMQVSILMNRSR